MGSRTSRACSPRDVQGARSRPWREVATDSDRAVPDASGGDGNSRSDRGTTSDIHLSWSPIFDDHGTKAVLINTSNPHYSLYEDCLRYLRQEYPLESLAVHPFVDNLTTQSLSRQVTPHFDALVNLFASKYVFEELSREDAEEHLDRAGRLRGDVVLDFVVSGVLQTLRVRRRGLGCHAVCLFMTSSVTRTESDVYRALFLEVVTLLWFIEWRLRTRVETRSPMPWSRASLRELSRTEPVIPEPPTFSLPSKFHGVGEEDPTGENDPQLRMLRFICGSPIDIPWLNARHDGYPFCSTLSRYTKTRRDAVPHGFHDDAALWISAMTFGLLEAVTRQRIPESTFLVPGAREGEHMLSGTRIFHFLVTWSAEAAKHEDVVAHRAHGKEVVQLLDRALCALDDEVEPATSILLRGGLPQHVARDVLGSVSLTVTSLCLVALTVWDSATLPEIHSVGVVGTEEGARRFPIPTLGACARRMYLAGWCPYAVGASFLWSLRTLAMVSNLARLPPYIRSTPDEHRGCSLNSCVFYTISDPDSYVPRHVQESCHCEYTHPPLTEVESLLSRNIVPCVVYDGETLRVQAAAAGPYVAISHVWADGMGSTTDQGLPICVVSRIAALVRGLLPESGAFWMDSLCVPAGGTLRKRAIKLMADTYRGAAKVLVIDDCIRAQCSERKPWEENLFRIALSGWVRRVWTLQEGLLARQLYFEFVEGPVNVQERLEQEASTDGAGGGPAMLPASWPQSPGMRYFAGGEGPVGGWDSLLPLLFFRIRNRDLDPHKALTLNGVIPLLQRRTTTKPEDELIAIASLLPVDVDALLAIAGPDAAQRRMRAFLLQQRDVSRLFPMDGGARLALPCFSWAPRTLASTAREGGHHADAGTGICTEHGFFADYFMIPFDSPVALYPSERGDDGPVHVLAAMPHASPGTCAATFTLNIHLRGDSPPDPALAIDALLFTDGTLSTQLQTTCFGVSTDSRNVPPRMQTSGVRLPHAIASGALPRPCRYVAPCALTPTRLRHDGPPPGNCYMMGELRKASVLLT